MIPHWSDDDVTLYAGDCLDVLRELPDASVDAVVTDPPAGIAFMGREWDHHKGGRDQWVAWLSAILAECLRVTKPGGHAFVWALPRTSGWTHRALEDAGWEVRDCVVHLFGSGFPKSLDVGKAIDRAAGAEREVVGRRTPRGGNDTAIGDAHVPGGMYRWSEVSTWDDLPANAQAYYTAAADRKLDVTAPATDDARTWQGWGTSLKPASEHWYLARKPLIGTVSQNVLAYGTGGINVDACRVDYDGTPAHAHFDGRQTAQTGGVWPGHGSRLTPPHTAGRWPPNVLLGPDAAAELDRQSGTLTSHDTTPGGNHAATHAGTGYNEGWAYTKRPPGRGDSGGASRFFPVFHPDAEEALCTEPTTGPSSSPAPDADEPPRSTTPTTPASGASTIGPPITAGDFPVFKYEAKAPTSERPRVAGEGNGKQNYGGYKVKSCDTCGTRFPSTEPPPCGHPAWSWVEPLDRAPGHVAHPTVKPLALMRWLVRLVTPPGGTVLDPFAGSGTTGEAAIHEHMRAILIEREADYLPLIVARLTKPHAVGFDLEGIA